MVMVLIGRLIYLLYIYIFYYYSCCYHSLFNFHHQNRIVTPTNEQIFHWVETINQYMFPYDHIITYAYITILHKLMSLVFESFVPIMWQFLLTQSRNPSGVPQSLAKSLQRRKVGRCGKPQDGDTNRSATTLSIYIYIFT